MFFLFWRNGCEPKATRSRDREKTVTWLQENIANTRHKQREKVYNANASHNLYVLCTQLVLDWNESESESKKEKRKERMKERKRDGINDLNSFYEQHAQWALLHLQGKWQSQWSHLIMSYLFFSLTRSLYSIWSCCSSDSMIDAITLIANFFPFKSSLLQPEKKQ